MADSDLKEALKSSTEYAMGKARRQAADVDPDLSINPKRNKRSRPYRRGYYRFKSKY